MRITWPTRRSARCWWLVTLAVYAAPAASGETEAMSTPDSRVLSAIELMGGFAERTGTTSDRPQQRYLWTDSFAVCNLLGLARVTGDEQYKQARSEVGRAACIRSWGATVAMVRVPGGSAAWSDREGENHPTHGGLRIGKRLAERGPAEPFDEAPRVGPGRSVLPLPDEMDASARSGRRDRHCDRRFSRWARELAAKAHAAFRLHPHRAAGARDCTGR